MKFFSKFQGNNIEVVAEESLVFFRGLTVNFLSGKLPCVYTNMLDIMLSKLKELCKNQVISVMVSANF